MKLFSWNTAGRSNLIEKQIDTIRYFDPDIVCLQEIQSNGDEIWKKILSEKYNYVFSSLNHTQDRSKTGPRKYHLIIASKEPIVLDKLSSDFVPWKERLLVVKLEKKALKIATTHIPPGCNNGWIKIEFFEGLFKLLSEENVILTGDFNSPRKEFSDGSTMTWGQAFNSKGEIKIRKKIKGLEGQRWHDAEYNLLKGITKINYVDYFRYLNSFEETAYSWISNVNSNNKYRFDHALGPNNIVPIEAKYVNDIIDQKLSDHAPLVLDFKL